MAQSEEARRAASERMKAYHAAKKAEKLNETENEDVVSDRSDIVSSDSTEVPGSDIKEETPNIGGVSLTNEQFEMLLQRFSGMAQDTPKKIQGVDIIERFPVSAANYRSPVEALYDLPQLRRFGMRENYIIDWKVSQTRYETRQGQWYIEPRFEITLKRKQYDPETGEELVKFDKTGNPFHPRIVLGRASFFVDPPADMIEAELAGLENAGLTDEELQDRMQFWRYSMWIEERIVPKRPAMTTNAKKEEVIGGKAYEIEEYSTPA